MDSFSITSFFTTTNPEETSVPSTDAQPKGGAGGYFVIAKQETEQILDYENPKGGAGGYCVIA